MEETLTYKPTLGQKFSAFVNAVFYFFGTTQGIVTLTIIAITPEAYASNAFYAQIFEGRGIDNSAISIASVSIIYLVGSFGMAVNDKRNMSHLFTFIGGVIAVVGWCIFFAKENGSDIVNYNQLENAVLNNAYLWVMIIFGIINMIVLFVLFEIIYTRNSHNVADRKATELIETNVYKEVRRRKAEAWQKQQLNRIEQKVNTMEQSGNTTVTEPNKRVTKKKSGVSNKALEKFNQFNLANN